MGSRRHWWVMGRALNSRLARSLLPAVAFPIAGPFFFSAEGCKNGCPMVRGFGLVGFDLLGIPRGLFLMFSRSLKDGDWLFYCSSFLFWSDTAMLYVSI